MARICVVCDKRPRVANLVSHANNKVKRWVYPNVHRMRFTLCADGGNRVHAGSVCAKCVKAGKVKKIV
ncbi:MAG TPA: 50S ribosomal protein L28 [Candidatus Babeliales bacterium]|jgi:large subunit ribosomal protein L28|nr:50S ribosomal protein L28 [Candidatus Babeliales bacterium]